MTTATLVSRRPREPLGRQIAASGFWAIIGFVGVSVLAGQFVDIARGAVVDEALGLALAGAALAAYAWYRARRALRRAAKPDVTPVTWQPDTIAAAGVAPHR